MILGSYNFVVHFLVFLRVGDFEMENHIKISKQDKEPGTEEYKVENYMQTLLYKR